MENTKKTQNKQPKRIASRLLARELKEEELARVSGAGGGGLSKTVHAGEDSDYENH